MLTAVVAVALCGKYTHQLMWRESRMLKMMKTGEWAAYRSIANLFKSDNLPNTKLSSSSIIPLESTKSNSVPPLNPMFLATSLKM